MNRLPFSARWRAALALLAALSLVQLAGLAQTAPTAKPAPKLHPHRIAVFGSSVANGRGDEFARDGYGGLLRLMMAKKGWEVLNQSRGGDTTKSMLPRFSPEGTPDPKIRYLTTVSPSYAIIALAFGNEGLFEAKTKAEKDAVYQGYLDGIKLFVDKSRQAGIVPIVALSYTRGVYTLEDYDYVKRANIVQEQWDVPTVNFLGATDDGTGRWSLPWDDKHPQFSGHREMMMTFVPTLFEALEKGKPVPTRPANVKGFARIADGGSPMTFAPEEMMHPFALSMMVRTQSNGTVAAISGTTLTTKMEIRKNEGNDMQAITLVPDKAFNASIGVQNGKWAYKSSSGTMVDSGVATDGKWHHVVLSHYTANNLTLFFVDGKQVGKAAERLEPTNFVVGGPGATGAAAGPKQADYKDVMLFRSAINGDEAAVLSQGKLLSGSLEIYAPLNDASFVSGAAVENRAQSLTSFTLGKDKVARFEEGAGTN